MGTLQTNELLPIQPSAHHIAYAIVTAAVGAVKSFFLATSEDYALSGRGILAGRLTASPKIPFSCNKAPATSV
jgi:hypothetical protein